MDSSAVVLRQPLRYSSSCYSASHSSSSKELKTASVTVGRRRPASIILSSGFYDQGSLQYYSSNSGPSPTVGMMTITSGKEDKITKEKSPKKMKKKKQLKLLKGLSRDLSTFSQMGFGLDSNSALLDQVKGDMISEAAEALLEQLQKLKANEKELKRKMKEEKARLKAAQRQNKLIDCKMSSSSSSESSSDSECGEVVDMNALKNAQKNKNSSQEFIEKPTSLDPIPIIATITSSQPDVSKEIPLPILPSTPITDYNKMSSKIASSSNVENDESKKTGEENKNCIVSPTCSKKIEVCMGGKCKKSGGAALLEKFQGLVGIEGAVSGCKCMGKCRNGPNVKVLNGVGDSSVKALGNSLCIGVGLEDVDMIVANLLGENYEQFGLVAAASS